MSTSASSRSASPPRVPTPPADNLTGWKKFIEAKVHKRPKVNQVRKVQLPDWKYFENYKEDRRKPWRPSRDLEIQAFISLQHLIIARFGRELESVNDEIFKGLRTQKDDEVCDVEMLWEAQEAMHLYCEAIDDLENMLKRRTAHVDMARRIHPEQKAYLEALTERGVELRLLDAGQPTAMTRAVNIMGSLFFGWILTLIGIGTLLVPMLLILLNPDWSKGAVVGIVIGSLAYLSICLLLYSVYFGLLDIFGMPAAGREVMSGKEILGYLAAYAAVLFVFVGAYLSPDQSSGQSSSG